MTDLLTANDAPGAYPASYYAATAETLAPFAPLRGGARADVCVVGGGYTGLSAALHLAQAGLSVVLLDAQRVGFGASGRNGGQLGTGWRKDQQWIEARLGLETAKELWTMAEEAKALTKALVAEHAPEAQYKPGVAYTCWKAADVPDEHAYAEHMARSYGYHRIVPLDRAACRDLVHSDAYHGGILDWGAGHIHPLRYALGLARACVAAGVRICETSTVKRITQGGEVRVETDAGHVTADHVILATNGYDALHRQVKARVMPINNFIGATEPLDDPARVLAQDIAVADSKFVVNYFRLSEGRLLFGGGESYGYRFPRDLGRVVRKPMLEVFPQLRDVAFTHVWGGTLAITAQRLPHFARLAPNVLSAGGFSGHGVALASFAGKVMAEAVTGTAARFDVLERLPTTPFPGGGALRSPLLALAMTWFALRDRMGL
ncbi:NAD(P)/FAD-dependent oxidoreductase [Pseudaestuariivita sp.]|uniref:NAD(P)/FAD-dependent oxidoreductase n=1 Tax=Pseudaestuariivita sp. TaxID=2211669 RepID=UPI0040584143